MKSRRIIFIHSSRDGAVRKIHGVPPFILCFVIVAGVLLALASGFVGYKISLSYTDFGRTGLVQGSDIERAGKIKALSKKVERLDEELHVLKGYNRRLKEASRDILGLPEELIGMGGSEGDSSETPRGISAIAGRALSPGIEPHIEKLGEEIALEQEAAQRLIAEIENQRWLIAHTPTLCPTLGFLSSRFGWRESPFSDSTEFHKGIDIAARKATPVYSPADGVVTSYYRSETFGNVLVIDHGRGIVTKYGHLLDSSVEVGKRVRKGEMIASLGSSGSSSGPHLHYEIVVNGVHVNPRRYMLK